MINLNQEASRNRKAATRALRTSPTHSFWVGMKMSGMGTIASVPFLAMELGSAQKGEILPMTLGRTASLVAFPALSGSLAAGGAMAAAAAGIAVPGIGAFAMLASLYADTLITEGIAHEVRTLTQEGTRLRHLEVGGHYQDTTTALRLRQQALYEMSGATSASRRYLGQEAQFLHQ